MIRKCYRTYRQFKKTNINNYWLNTQLSDTRIVFLQKTQMSPPFRNQKILTLHLVMLQGKYFEKMYMQELWFLCKTRCLNVLYKCMKFR